MVVAFNADAMRNFVIRWLLGINEWDEVQKEVSISTNLLIDGFINLNLFAVKFLKSPAKLANEKWKVTLQ